MKNKTIITTAFILFILALNLSNIDPACSEPIITGKVVGVADGDTITVLQNNREYKIRLYGIDTPEKGQDFGNKAKEVTSGFVFNKEVKVIQKDVDRYGRIVGIVYVGGTCINQEIIRAGYAWVYKQYCKDSFCRDWINLETQARANQIGLWSHPEPVPPWDYRRGARDTSKLKAIVPGAYHGNTSSHVFHKKGCKHFNCKNCTVVFHSREEAIKEGFRPCGGCRP